MKHARWTLAAAAGLSLLYPGGAGAQPAPADAGAPIKMGVVTFLTGPAASPFGVPSRNAAEIVIEALNSGKAPAPYNTVGLGGTKIEAKYVDETGSTAQVVTEYRNMVQRDNVDLVVGYISSGSCLAVTPVAEELKTLTVYFDCGTPRIFEEKPRKYVFRPPPHATMDNVAAARFLMHLGALLRDDALRATVDRALAYLGPQVRFETAWGTGALALAFEERLLGPIEITIVRGGDDALAKKMRDEMARVYEPRKIVRLEDAGHYPKPKTGAAIYVCTPVACSSPAATTEIARQNVERMTLAQNAPCQ
jgi:hypothetical protein